MGRLKMARVWRYVYHISGDIVLLLCLMVAMENRLQVGKKQKKQQLGAREEKILFSGLGFRFILEGFNFKTVAKPWC